MPSENVLDTYSWLRASGFMKGSPMTALRVFTLDEATAISRAFDRGNYANAYESTCLDDHDIDDMPEIEKHAFVLGFFGSYSLDEIGLDRETFDEAYFSAAGKHVLSRGYTDCRADEYAAPQSSSGR